MRDLHRDRICADYRLQDSAFETFDFARAAVEAADDARRDLESFRDACRDEAVVAELIEAIAELKARRGL